MPINKSYRNKEAIYNFYKVPDCTAKLENSVLLRVTSRQQCFPCIPEMLELCTEASRRRKLRRQPRAMHFEKPLCVDYIADRLNTDDPINGYLVRCKDTGWLQGFIVLTTFTTWQKWFKFDSVSSYDQLADYYGKKKKSKRKIDSNGSLALWLESHKRTGNAKTGMVWNNVAEISLLGALRCGRWLVSMIMQELAENIHCIVLQATDESIPFYETLGFVRVGCLAKYVPKGSVLEDAPIVPYRHWTYADQNVSKMPEGPSYMMAIKIAKERRVRKGSRKKINISKYLVTKAPKIVRTPRPIGLACRPIAETNYLKRQKRRERDRQRRNAEEKPKPKLTKDSYNVVEVIVRLRCQGLTRFLSAKPPLKYLKQMTSTEARIARGIRRRNRYIAKVSTLDVFRVTKTDNALRKRKVISPRSRAASSKRQKYAQYSISNDTNIVGDSDSDCHAGYESAVSTPSDYSEECDDDTTPSSSDYEPEETFSRPREKRGSRRSTRISKSEMEQKSKRTTRSSRSTTRTTTSTKRNKEILDRKRGKLEKHTSLKVYVKKHNLKKKYNFKGDTVKSKTGKINDTLLKSKETELLRLLNKVVRIDSKAQLGAPLRLTRARLQGKPVTWRHTLSPRSQCDSTFESRMTSNSSPKYFFVVRYDVACNPPHCQLLPLKPVGYFDKRGQRGGRIRWKLVDGGEIGVEAQYCHAVSSVMVCKAKIIDPKKFTWDIIDDTHDKKSKKTTKITKKKGLKRSTPLRRSRRA